MTTVQTEARPSRPGMGWMVLGLALLAAPLLLVTVFAIGEGVGGEGGWWGHLIQLAVGLVLLVGAWFFPKVVGPLIVVAGLALGVVLLAGANAGSVIGPALIILALPMVLAGVFVTLAGFSRRPGAVPTEPTGPEQP